MSTYNTKSRKIEVIAYSGYKANERPICFMLDSDKKTVKEILKQWYGQDHDYFKVLADDGGMYLLKWHRSSDSWFVQSSVV